VHDHVDVVEVDTEQLVRLPSGFSCFTPPLIAPPPGPLPGASAGHITFGSLHNLTKLNSQVLDLWARLLTHVPRSRLLLFRNTLKGTALEFGCEILSDNPEAASAAAENAPEGEVRVPVIVLPPPAGKAAADDALPQIIVATGAFAVDHGVALTRGKKTGFAVLTKLVEQGPGFEIYDYAPVT